ncbi:MAG: hypothetical protein ACOX2O_03560 [Bdellovibrionota bacterium]|jgi:hypothetical protein
MISRIFKKIRLNCCNSSKVVTKHLIVATLFSLLAPSFLSAASLSSSLDNTLKNRAFKKINPLSLPFGMSTGNSVFLGGDIATFDNNTSSGLNVGGLKEEMPTLTDHNGESILKLFNTPVSNKDKAPLLSSTYSTTIVSIPNFSVIYVTIK